jgi:hypothetical protein
VKAQGSVRRHVPAGVADATIASIASFGAGLTGVTLLTETDRGVYGVFFTAFMLGGIIVSELIYVPAQVVALPPSDRHDSPAYQRRYVSVSSRAQSAHSSRSSRGSSCATRRQRRQSLPSL